MRKKIILDFDGTITDIEKESKDFQEIYPSVLFKELGINENKNLPLFEKIKETLKYNEVKGFELYGRDSLPASADPYILTQSTGLEFRKKFNYLAEDETKFLIFLYEKTTSKIFRFKTYYREGKNRTKKFLDYLLKNNTINIVTTSKKEKVEYYLKELGGKYFEKIHIIGNAKKLFIDKDFKIVPFSYIPSGFPRENLLRRKEYYRILKDLKKEGFTEGKTTVIGDVYETDLGLPDYLGYKIIQIENGYSKKHERDYLGKNFVRNYDELEKLIL